MYLFWRRFSRSSSSFALEVVEDLDGVVRVDEFWVDLIGVDREEYDLRGDFPHRFSVCLEQ